KHWKKVQEALEIVGLADYAERQISQLSGGQFQRVLIARCLVQEADYILLDEPFAGIDSVSEEIIMNTLRDLKKAGKTVLIVHHDLSKIPHYFDQVLLVNREVIAFGPTKETFTETNLKEAYGNQLFFNGGDL
ncbi:metal ABC transporter ATP-binding protein, partial [Streptococcus pneumoniae]